MIPGFASGCEAARRAARGNAYALEIDGDSASHLNSRIIVERVAPALKIAELRRGRVMPVSLNTVAIPHAPRGRRRGALLAAAVIAAIGPTEAPAQNVSSVWFGGTGVWESAANWANTPAVPYFPQYHAGGFLYDATVNAGEAQATTHIDVEAFKLTGGGVRVDDELAVTNFNWSGGTVSGAGTVRSYDANTWSGGAKTLQSTVVELLADTNWTAGDVQGDLQLGLGQIYTFGGAFKTNFDGALTADVFENNAEFRKTAGTAAGVTRIDAEFNNFGDVYVDAGTLHLTTGGRGEAAFHVAAGATLKFGSPDRFATYHLSGPAVVDGDGTVWVAESFSGTSLSFESGTFMPATLRVSGGFDAQVPVYTKRLIVEGAARLQPNDTIVTDAFEWTGGQLDGAAWVEVAGNATLSGAAAKTLDSGLKLKGQTSWTGGNISGFRFDAFLENSGTMITDFDGSWSTEAPFTNTGLFRKTAGTVGPDPFENNTTIFSDFYNSGTVRISAGALRIGGSGSSAGTITVDAGAVLYVSNRSFTVDAGSVTGDGTVWFDTGQAPGSSNVFLKGGTYDPANTRIVNARVNFDAPASTTNLYLDGGTLGGSSAFTATNLYSNDGAMDGMGSTTVTGVAQLTGAYFDLGSRTLNLLGNTTCAAGQVANGTIDNAGTLTLVADAPIGFYSALSNTGLLAKSGSATASLNRAFVNTGTVRVSAGTLAVNAGGTHAGRFEILPGATLAFTAFSIPPVEYVLDGATVTGGGALRLDIGNLSVNGGAYAPGATVVTGGRLTLNVPGANTGTLTVSGGQLSAGASFAAGSLDWSGGTMSDPGTTTVSGPATFGGTGQKSLTNRTLNLGGASAWSGGPIFLSASTVNVLAGATFDVSAANTVGSGGGPNLVANAGTITKSSPSIALVNVPFVNAAGAQVLVNDGTLGLTGGGTNAGGIAVAAGATLRVAANFNHAAGGSITGPGTLDFQAATVVVDGNVTFDGALAFNSSTATVRSNSTVSKVTLTNSSATVAAAGSLNVGAGGLAFTGSASDAITLQPSATTPGRLVLAGDVDFAGTAGTASINTANFSVGQTPGTLDLGAAARTFTVADGAATIDMAVSARLANGSVVKSGPGRMRLDAANAHASTTIAGGTLEVLDPGGLGAGPVTLAGGNLALRTDAGGTVNFANDVTLSADGTIDVNRISAGTAGAIRLGVVTVNGTSKLTTTGANRTLAVTGLTLGGNPATGVDTSVDLVVQGPVAQAVAGAGLAKGGTAKLTLAGTTANAHTGLTRVNAGTLELAKPAGVAAVPADLAVFGGTARWLADHQVDDAANVTASNAGTTVDLNGHSETVASLTVTNALVTIGAAAPAGAAVLRTGSLSVSGAAGKLDLNDNRLIVDYAAAAPSPIAGVRQMIANAYAGGAWAGASGLASSAATADTSRALGYAEAGELLGQAGGTFAGQIVDGSAVLVRYTLAGDANLDGAVDFDDLVKLAQNYNVADGQRTWFGGDFTYDGSTDFNDLVKLAQNYNAALPVGAVAGAPADFDADLARALAATAPEPGGPVALAVAATAAAAFGPSTRRRKRTPR
jgi:autotransporter-associated beta strand protein